MNAAGAVMTIDQGLKRCVELIQSGQRMEASSFASKFYRSLQDQTDREMFMARLSAHTKQDPAALARMFEQGPSPSINAPLWSVGALGWLDPTDPPPVMPCLLTVQQNGKGECFLPLGRTAMLAAPGGTGKTQALMQLAVSVATGKPWLDTYKVAAPGPVLVLMGEEDKDEFHRRLTGCVKALDLWKDKEAMHNLGTNLYALPLYGTDVMLTDEDGNETLFAMTLMERLQELTVDWRLVILDPASRFMGPECELDNKAATTWIECLERMTKVRGGPVVMFAHHMNKSGLTGETDQGAARGSSALTDGARWQANLDVVLEESDDDEKDRDSQKPRRRTDPNHCTLRVVKSNYGPRPGPLELERDGVNGGHLKPVKFMAKASKVMT